MTKKKSFTTKKIDVEALFEATCRRLLWEYTSTPEEEADIKHSRHVRTLMPLAALVRDDGSEKTAILYSPEDVDKLLRTYKDADERRGGDSSFYWKKIKLTEKSIEGAIRGVIQIREPGQPCWDAWEVIASAGPGGADIARTIYGLGYAMSPSGVIMPDRGTVSAPAKAAWARVASKGDRYALPLDDIDDPQTSDPQDDCKLYRGKSKNTDPKDNPALQNAYQAQGWEKGMLNYLTAAHESFIDDLRREDPKLSSTLEKYLTLSIHAYFKHHYPGGAGD